MDVWSFILSKLNAAVNIQLLCVLESEGSSPGRQGFKMAVAADGEFFGTIGGGIMEHKLVEKAKSMLQQNGDIVLLRRQHHDKEHAVNRSGMICSGSQLNAFIPLTDADKETIEKINGDEKLTVQLSPLGLSIIDRPPTGLVYRSENDWNYTEASHEQPVVHIIGGGHVSLALSELMCFLGFFSIVYDDRPELNTMLHNYFANKKIVISGYENLGAYIDEGLNNYAVIMTIGYQTDKIALRALLKKDFNYLGMMGSDNKIETLISELKAEGVNDGLLEKIFMPVGINIYSKTPQEIAVSIAAEIIREKNRELPTGRKY